MGEDWESETIQPQKKPGVETLNIEGRRAKRSRHVQVKRQSAAQPYADGYTYSLTRWTEQLVKKDGLLPLYGVAS